MVKNFDKFMYGNFDNLNTKSGIILRSCKAVLPLIIERELTPQQAKVFTEYYYNNRSQTAIAGLMHITQPTVSRHLDLARDKIIICLHYALSACKKVAEYYESEVINSGQ